MPDSQDLRDRVAHATVFTEATLRALQEALRLIDDAPTEEICRECREAFPYSEDADICPSCVKAMHPDSEREEAENDAGA
jgi:Zn finger protein HypA/HybF involved in hydrogenase expression